MIYEINYNFPFSTCTSIEAKKKKVDEGMEIGIRAFFM